MRKLGLDVGSKSCGIAISDPLNITAQGIENFMFEEYEFDILLEKVKDVLTQYEVDVIVIGRPTLPSGDPSQTTIMIEEFKESLEKVVTQQIVFVDENMTTKKANAIMIKAGLSREKRKQFKDKIASQLILEEYLQFLP